MAQAPIKMQEQLETLQDKLKDVGYISAYRKCYFESLIRYVREQLQCGCNDAAGLILKKLNAKLHAELESTNRSIQKKLDFRDVDDALNRHSQNDCLSLLERHRRLFSDETYIRLKERIGKDAPSGDDILRPSPMQLGSKINKLRQALLNKISLHANPKTYCDASAAIKGNEEKVGIYNTTYNIKSFLRLMESFDNGWVLDFLAHYRRLNSLKNLF